ncbi:hypothetical protein IC608_06005 [Devosia sp. PTR5]|uniref:Porin n=1 Tax=Devosia oryzisoli TaxID=2774138 RepID=A0A927FTS6_9HYPH|nr:hypothetical protein [Devosia oryzisoli]MBD8065024.1 hypothetical protein [Devosia oryzisoli]
MKLKSLILGSVAAAGLSTAGYAADLGVLTSLDVCDALGLSGLTISSDTNCLQISGEVKYEFKWGDYRGTTAAGENTAYVGQVPVRGVNANVDTIRSSDDFPIVGDSELDYESKVEAWLKFVGTADSDFGPAKATLKLKSIDQRRYTNEGDTAAGGAVSLVDDQYFDIDEAYVSIGDSTVIMAGKKSSIANFGDSQPFNYLTTFGYDKVDTGVLFQNDEDEDFTGKHSIQITSDLGNGVNVSAGLENLAGTGGTTGAAGAGTLVGVVSYTGESLTAHITGLAIGVLDGEVDAWGVHAGATGTFDMFKIRAAVGYADWAAGNYRGVGESNELHALISGEAAFDMFKVALTGEYTRNEDEATGFVDDGYGVGGSIGVNVTEGVEINLGARYFSANFDTLAAPLDDQSMTQVAARIIASLTETIKVTGEVGAYFNDGDYPVTDGLYYGAAELAWAPGGNFTSSVKGELNSEGAYRMTFKAAKAFQ